MIPRWLEHPLSGVGASFWGGIGGYLTVLAAILLAGYRSYRRHQCHADRCWRPAWHPDPVHGHPVCWHHHPNGGDENHTIGGTPADHVLR